MKKILGVAAVLLATGAICAEEITGGGGLKTTVQVQTGLMSNLTEHETYNIGSYGNRNRVNIKMNYSGENCGVETYFRSQWNESGTFYTNKTTSKGSVTATTDTTTTYTYTGEESSVTRSASMMYLRHAYGWANLFGGNVKLDAGLLSVETWEDSYEGDSDLQGGGMQLEITPQAVPGLNVGAAFIARDYNDDKATVNWDKKHWTAGARYDEPDGKYTAVLGWEGGASTVWDRKGDGSYDGDAEFIWAEFSMWGMPGLSALALGASGYVYNPIYQKDERYGELGILFCELDVGQIAESVPLTLGLYGYGWFYQFGDDYRADTNSDEAPDGYQEFEVEGYAAYKINDKIKVEGAAAYWRTTEDLDDDDDKAQWWSKIGVAYQVEKSTTLSAYYGHKSLNYGGFGGMELAAPPSRISGYDFIALDFRCSF